MSHSEHANLIEAALNARQYAHAPYSKFRVGTALLTESGNFYCGVNVENISYGLTICAERSAIVSAIAAGETKFKILVLALPGGGTPCGACRQVISEFCDDLPILIVDSDNPEQIEETSLDILLPQRFAFTPPEENAEE